MEASDPETGQSEHNCCPTAAGGGFEGCLEKQSDGTIFHGPSCDGAERIAVHSEKTEERVRFGEETRAAQASHTSLKVA